METYIFTIIRHRIFALVGVFHPLLRLEGTLYDGRGFPGAPVSRRVLQSLLLAHEEVLGGHPGDEQACGGRDEEEEEPSLKGQETATTTPVVK